jgi:hypothetical protein
VCTITMVERVVAGGVNTRNRFHQAEASLRRLPAYGTVPVNHLLTPESVAVQEFATFTVAGDTPGPLKSDAKPIQGSYPWDRE